MLQRGTSPNLDELLAERPVTCGVTVPEGRIHLIEQVTHPLLVEIWLFNCVLHAVPPVLREKERNNSH